jgi:hypothetical protein
MLDVLMMVMLVQHCAVLFKENLNWFFIRGLNM